MKSAPFVFACALLAASTATAQPHAPLGPAPTFNVVRSTSPEKGTVFFARFTTMNVPVTVQERVLQNGMEVLVTKTVFQTVTREEMIVVDISKGRVITPDSKQLPIDEVWKRLKPNTVVVVSGDSNTPAPAYLRALSAETLILIPAPLKK